MINSGASSPTGAQRANGAITIARILDHDRQNTQTYDSELNLWPYMETITATGQSYHGDGSN